MSETHDYTFDREVMVDVIAARGVRDARVLAAMRAFPRHELLPGRLTQMAYADRALPLGEGQTISQPYVVAFMTEAVRVKPGGRVLDVGTGSGYQAGILAALGCEVFTIEIDTTLAHKAESNLRRIGFPHIHFRTGDGSLGWPEHAPFAAIIVAAAAQEVPPALFEQVGEGGRLIIPVGGDDEQVLEIHERRADEFMRIRSVPVRFVPLLRRVLH